MDILAALRSGIGIIIGIAGIATIFINMGIWIAQRKRINEKIEEVIKSLITLKEAQEAHENKIKGLLFRPDGAQILTRAEKTDFLEKNLHKIENELNYFKTETLTTFAEILTRLDLISKHALMAIKEIKK